MLCPNELGCTFSRYMIPRTNGEEDLYEMFDGTFLVGDMCNFKVTNPVASDLNDVMYFKLEYTKRCTAVLIKGESLDNPFAMYRLSVGQSYTALKGINFYLLFIATDETSGDFAFTISYNSVSGYGEAEPTVVTQETNPRDPNSNSEEEEKEEEKTDETPETDDQNKDEEAKTDEETKVADTTDNSNTTTDNSNTDSSGGSSSGGDINPDDNEAETIGGIDDDNNDGSNTDKQDGLNKEEVIGGKDTDIVDDGNEKDNVIDDAGKN